MTPSQPAPSPSPGRSTADDRVAALVGGSPSLTMVELAEEAGVSLSTARLFWRAMGFPNVADDEVTFTPRDADALRSLGQLLDGLQLDRTTAVSLLRAQSYLADRLVLRSEEHTSELQSRGHLVCRLLLDKKKNEPPP